MNRLLYAAILCCGLCAGVSCSRAAGDARPVRDAASTNKTATAGKPQTTCPVMGGPIDRSIFVDAAGKRIYLCCGGCVGKVHKEPGKYIQQLEAAGIVLEAAPAAPSK